MAGKGSARPQGIHRVIRNPVAGQTGEIDDAKATGFGSFSVNNNTQFDLLVSPDNQPVSGASGTYTVGAGRSVRLPFGGTYLFYQFASVGNTNIGIPTSPRADFFLSPLPTEYSDTPINEASLVQVTHPVVGVGTGADLWKPTAGKTARVYSIVLSGDTAGDYAAQDSATGGNIAAAHLAVGIPAAFDYKPYGFLLSAVNAKVTVTGPGLITATATGDEE